MINLTVVIDNDEAVRKLRELQNVAKSTTSSVVKDSEQVDAAWSRMTDTLKGMIAGYTFQSLARQIVQVRGEVQQLEIAFETMLGSKAKADALMSEMMTLAAATPFGLQDVTGAAKQLLAFGSTSEEVAKEITMLGDIAAGMSIPLNDMIYLYGTTRTQGRLFTQDLRQFMGRGIPLAEELAKQFGVTKDKVGELVTAGKVGFPEVQKALEAMTSEGGKFGGLMEKQSQSVAGQVSALEDAIYQMFNEIGQSSEGVISDVLAGASWVVEHYEAILNILSKVIIAWGTYKAALIITAAYHKVLALAKLAGGLIQVAKGARTAAAAWRAFNMAVKSNPIGLALSAVATLGAVIWDMCSATEDATGETEEFAREIGELEQAARDEFIEVRRLAYEYEHLATTEEERADILKQLKDINPDIVDGVDALSGAYEQLTQNVAEYCAQQLQSIQLASLTDKQNDALERQGKAMADIVSGDARLQTQLVNLQSEIMSGAFSANDIKLVRVGGTAYSISETMRNNVFDKIKTALGIDGNGNIRADFEITPENARNIADQIAHAQVIVEASGPSTYYGGTSRGKGYYQYRDEDSFGGRYNFEDLLQSILEAEDEAKAAKEELELILQDMPAILKSLGFEENPYEKKEGDGADTAKKYLDALREAREKYLQEQREFAAVKNNPEATEAQYYTAEEELKAAEDNYKKLGGVTKQGQNDQEKQLKEYAKRMQQLEYDSQQAIIDIMAEGTDKKLAQLDLDYQKRMDAISEQEAELLAKQGSLTEQQAAMFANIRAGASGTLRSGYAEVLFDGAEEEVDKELDKLISHYEAELKAMDDYLIKYGTFKEQMLATTRKYNQLIADAETEGEKKMLETERDAILAEYEERTSEWAKGLVDKSTAQLNEMVTELQAEVDAKQAALDALDSSDSTTAQQYREEINKLNAQIKILQELLNKANKAVKDDNWADATQVFQNISQAANDAAEGIEEFDEGLATALRGIANLSSTATNMIGAIQGVMTAFAEGVKGIEKASAILAVVGAAIQAVSVLISLFKGSDEVEQTMRQFKELNAELERFRKLAQIDSVEGTIFGENAFANFSNNLRVMREALDELNESKNKIRDYRLDYWAENVLGGAYASGAKYDSYEKALANMQVKTRDRSGFAEFFGATDEYAKLGDLYPELFAGGEVTLEGLRKLKESDVWEKLSQENRDLIDELIADWEYYEEATEAVASYLTDIFGGLGDSITDALVSAFENGTDAAEAMGDAFTEVIERLARDMVMASFIQPLLNDAQAAITELSNRRGELTDEEYINELMNIGSNLIDGALAQEENAAHFLRALDERMAELGYEGAFDGDGDGQSATQKGFQAMSQDTGDELNGRFTDIQGKVSGIHEAVQFMKSIGSQQLQSLTSIHATVADIRNDTTLIERHTRVLSTMSQDLSDLKRAVVNEGLI